MVKEGVDPCELDTVVAKGFKARRTTWGGLSLRSGREYTPAVSSPLGGENGSDMVPPCPDFMTEIDVKFQYQQARCVPYSFLNVFGASKKNKGKLIKALGAGLCSIRDLCNPVGKIFGKSLTKVDKDMDWIIEQPTGLFLVFAELHCVGVDCEKKLIYDSALPTCLKLCKDAFAHCDIHKAEEVRQIV
jgi:hypothetical protein